MKELIALYRQRLEDAGFSGVRVDAGKDDVELNAQYQHLLWMLNQMDAMAEDPGPEDDDKLNRWLGFVQGVLWSTGIFTLTELRAQTRKALAA